ncbi:MAG: ion channel [Pseudoxanthomonas sp.]
MISYLLIGMPVILICLVLQAVLVAACLRYYTRFRNSQAQRNSQLADTMVLSVVMLLTLLGNCVQIAIWACLFLWLGEFHDFSAAFYHSSVNFVTLGYGDIVMSDEWRLLGPLEAANGILMFGVSTAVMTAAVIDVIKYNRAARESRPAKG